MNSYGQEQIQENINLCINSHYDRDLSCLLMCIDRWLSLNADGFEERWILEREWHDKHGEQICGLFSVR